MVAMLIVCTHIEHGFFIAQFHTLEPKVIGKTLNSMQLFLCNLHEI